MARDFRTMKCRAIPKFGANKSEIKQNYIISYQVDETMVVGYI